MPCQRFAALFAILALVSLPAIAQPAPELHITGSGEFVATRDVGPRDPAAASQGSDTVVMVEDPRIVRRTKQIEAQLCRRFGFMFTLENPGPDGTAELTVTSVHPPILHPGGRISTGVTYQMSASGDRSGLVGFSFDEPWELVPGTWTFSVHLDGRLLAEQRYDVVASPDPSPVTRVDCSAAVS